MDIFGLLLAVVLLAGAILLLVFLIKKQVIKKFFERRDTIKNDINYQVSTTKVLANIINWFFIQTILNIIFVILVAFGVGTLFMTEITEHGFVHYMGLILSLGYIGVIVVIIGAASIANTWLTFIRNSRYLKDENEFTAVSTEADE
jgi:hypothetical protein